MLLKKVRWISGLMMVFILIVATNLIDRQNFRTVKESINTIYHDRLVAKDLVFELTLLIHEKELALATNDSAFYREKNLELNRAVDELIERFYKTKLTPKEKRVLDAFNTHFNDLRTYESSFSISNKSKSTIQISKKIDQISVDLYALSKIQIDEGKLQLSLGEKSVGIIELFTQIEIGLLVLIGLIIQIIILYKPKNTH